MNTLNLAIIFGPQLCLLLHSILFTNDLISTHYYMPPKS